MASSARHLLCLRPESRSARAALPDRRHRRVCVRPAPLPGAEPRRRLRWTRGRPPRRSPQSRQPVPAARVAAAWQTAAGAVTDAAGAPALAAKPARMARSASDVGDRIPPAAAKASCTGLSAVCGAGGHSASGGASAVSAAMASSASTTSGLSRGSWPSRLSASSAASGRLRGSGAKASVARI